MAYTIQMNGDGAQARVVAFEEKLRDFFEKKLDGQVFVINEITKRFTYWPNGKIKKATLELRRIRLNTPKSYCGQHPGPCVANGRKKMKARYLEWNEWIMFHDLINGLLEHEEADVYSTPMECKGRMWIRRGRHPRRRWDYTERWPLGHMQPTRIWNNGTDDQFLPETLERPNTVRASVSP